MCDESGHEAGDMMHCSVFLKAYMDKCKNESVEPSEKHKRAFQDTLNKIQQKSLNSNNIHLSNLEARLNNKVATGLIITKSLYGTADTNQTQNCENLFSESFNYEYDRVKLNFNKHSNNK